MIAIRKKLVSDALAAKVTYGKGNTKKYITIHETDNKKNGANADAHARLQKNGNSREASWHWQVDNDEAIQSFEHEIRCWAAGSTKGNNESIHVEMCVNNDGNYKKTVENTAELVKKIMKEENISLINVVQHNYWSGKNCPSVMRSGKSITWSQFKNMLAIAQQEEKKESGSMYKPNNQAMNNSTATVLSRFENKDNGISPVHREKLLNGELSESDAIGLIYVAIERELFGK